MLSTRQTSILVLSLLLLLPLSLRHTLGAAIPPLSRWPTVPEKDISLPHLAEVQGESEQGEEHLRWMLAADVDGKEEDAASAGVINWYPSTNGKVLVGHHNYYLAGSSLTSSAGGGGGDDSVEETQTSGKVEEDLIAFNYDDTVIGAEGEEDAVGEGVSRAAVIANKWKRHLISGPTFDNCPSGTRLVRNECRDVLSLD